MEYNFSRAFGKTFKAENFKNVMKFIHAYNDAKERTGSTNETEIIAAMRGYDPVYAKSLLNVVKIKFTKVPERDEEVAFMQAYSRYMQETYREQRERVIEAQEKCDEKKYDAPNGVKYSAAKLMEAGKKAKSNTALAKWGKVILIALGAVAGSVLLPLLITTVFTGVASVSALATLTMLGGVAGLAGGGFLGAKVLDLIYGKEKQKANADLAKFFEKVKDGIELENSQAEAEREKLKELEKDFDLKLDEATGLMSSEEFDNVYNTYTSAPLVDMERDDLGADEYATDELLEDVAAAEDESRVIDPVVVGEVIADVSAVLEGEAPVDEHEIEEEVVDALDSRAAEDESEPVDVDEVVAEVVEELEDNAKAEEPVVAEVVVPVPVEEVVVVEEEEPEEAPEVPADNNPYTEPVTEDKRKRIKSSFVTKCTNAINVCSSVGRYMLIDLKLSTLAKIDEATTMGEIKEIVDETVPQINAIKNNYKLYQVNKSSNNITRKNLIYLEELAEDKQGAHAKDAALPKGYTQQFDEGTLYTAVAMSYVRQNRDYINRYAKAKYTEMTPGQRAKQTKAFRAKAAEIAKEGMPFEEMDKSAIAFQQELASEIKKVSVRAISESEAVEFELDLASHSIPAEDKPGKYSFTLADEDEAEAPAKPKIEKISKRQLEELGLGDEEQAGAIDALLKRKKTHGTAKRVQDEEQSSQ